MEAIKPCSPYHAVAVGRDLIRPRDGKSCFKVYFLDIVGRPDPARTVWAASGLDQRDYLGRLAAAGDVEGVGFVTAFPHITKVFRFGPEAETVLNVRAWNSRDMTPLGLARSHGYVEFACLAEALIAADEYRIWAEAESVADYLARWSDFADGAVLRHEKLRLHWNGGRP